MAGSAPKSSGKFLAVSVRSSGQWESGCGEREIMLFCPASVLGQRPDPHDKLAKRTAEADVSVPSQRFQTEFDDSLSLVPKVSPSPQLQALRPGQDVAEFFSHISWRLALGAMTSASRLLFLEVAKAARQPVSLPILYLRMFP